jgi:hypothetical protein
VTDAHKVGGCLRRQCAAISALPHIHTSLRFDT